MGQFWGANSDRNHHKIKEIKLVFLDGESWNRFCSLSKLTPVERLLGWGSTFNQFHYLGGQNNG